MYYRFAMVKTPQSKLFFCFTTFFIHFTYNFIFSPPNSALIYSILLAIRDAFLCTHSYAESIVKTMFLAKSQIRRNQWAPLPDWSLSVLRGTKRYRTLSNKFWSLIVSRMTGWSPINISMLAINGSKIRQPWAPSSFLLSSRDFKYFFYTILVRKWIASLLSH